MNQEFSSSTKGTSTGKTHSKRVHRSSRNRPVLVTASQKEAMLEEEHGEEADQPVQTMVAEEASSEPQVTPRRLPRFFASIGKSEKNTVQPEADPVAARLARATRGKVLNTDNTADPKEQKVAGTTNSVAKPVRPVSRSGFKSRYLWGMVLYLLIADVLGLYVTNFIRARGWDAAINIGPIPLMRSTLIFLVLLIVILLVMARLDLIPRSLGAMRNTPPASPTRSSRSSSSEPTFESKTPQATIKQGVKGSHDDLYQEYRENQRYFQKRDRKR